LVTRHKFNAAGVSDFGDELDLSMDKSFTLSDAELPFKKPNMLLKHAN
jgi:hypothetical protein